MIKEVICTGATIDEARNQAIAQLNAPEDVDVNTEVIDLPVKKILGLFGGSPAKVRAYYEYEECPIQETLDYLQAILKGMGLEGAEIGYEKTENGYELEINGIDPARHGVIIGRRGETLDAVQYLTSLVLNKSTEKYTRVSINIGDYRKKREVTLRNLAIRSAKKAVKTGRKVTLEPMNPYERRIIHNAVQEVEGASSHSIGENMDRRVVITSNTPRKPEAKRGTSRGGRRPRRYDRDRNDARTEQKSESRPRLNDADIPDELIQSFTAKVEQSAAAEPAVQEERAPRSDAPEAGSLYGMISPKENDAE